MNTSEPSRSAGYSESEHSVSDSFADDPVFHKQLKRVLFDVEVPEQGKESLLNALAQNQADVSSSDTLPSVSRRSFLKKPGTLVGLSTCLMLTALLAIFWVSRQPEISLASLNPELNLDSRLLSEFDDHFSTQLPVQGGWQNQGHLVLLDKTYGLSLGQSSVHDVAVRFFRLHTGRTRSVYGALLQIPAARVYPQPELTVFDSGKVEYSQLAKGNYATVKWVENDQVYVCIVFGGARELEALGRALQSAAA